MQIATIFTQEELRLISRGLTFGSIHTDNQSESSRMQELEQKINMLGAIQQTK